MKKFQPHQPRSLFGSLKSLKALCLKSVDVTDQDVDFFLRNCPLLEHLVVDYALKILNLNICGALALKHLGILYCMNVKSLKVSAPNLTSLRVTNAVALLLENVPKLVEVYVSNGYTDVDKLVPSLYCCLSQLEILTLRLNLQKYIEENCKFPVLPNLKKLEIQYFAGVESIIWVTSFMRAAPYLQEFVIKIYWYKFLRTEKNIKSLIHSPHQHLKVFKFLGYYGRASDVELVMYLLDNCAILEKLIIDPRYQAFFSYAGLDPAEVDAVQTSRNYAKQQLQGQVPRHIELLIL
ncbi:hypothetical protein PHJA_001453600 [Phtheirospermum japonicum]|uniref:At1g61320/AtMIF1 LRR domain-containing protein n=1 Tax=Phtheirospermum japonicum TaxID=374723 RepID=A0A830CAS5_9LAMI|nr:hypothetical protein PHJA_001453600 [Phtheirospermum japonicum]